MNDGDGDGDCDCDAAVGHTAVEVMSLKTEEGVEKGVVAASSTTAVAAVAAGNLDTELNHLLSGDFAKLAPKKVNTKPKSNKPAVAYVVPITHFI